MRCSATTAAGQPCRAYAVHGTEERYGAPLCSAHGGRNKACSEQGRKATGPPASNQNARTHGFYARQFSPEEMVDLVAVAGEIDLADEIGTSRIVLRRLLAYLNQAEPHEILAIAPLVMQSTGRIARLLRDQRILEGEATDNALGAIGLALDEISREWNIEL